MTTAPADAARPLIEDWVALPHTSARTVLVTIFGDTLEPVQASPWMAQLFRLTEPFGFNQRLVRTSMFRLASEGWVDNERVGRQSRYSLTDAARTETAEASKRIYDQPRHDWSGSWALVFLDAAHIEAAERERLAEHLGWQGFLAISKGLLGAPGLTGEQASERCRVIAPGVAVPTGTFAFDDVDEAVRGGLFDSALAVDELAAGYAEFIDFHRRCAELDHTSDDGTIAFALRTMLVQDLRRLRLRTSELPPSLLPDGGPGASAHAFAADRYRTLSAAAAPWLSEVLEVDYPSTIPGRFPDVAV